MKKIMAGLILLIASAATLAWLKQYAGGSLPGQSGGSQGIFTVTGGNLAVTIGSGGSANRNLLLENLVTFLNPGDEIKILEQKGQDTRIQVVKHNNFYTSVTGWVSTELIQKYAKPKN